MSRPARGIARTEWQAGRSAIREIPRSCTCEWEFSFYTRKYTRISTDWGCPWHRKILHDGEQP